MASSPAPASSSCNSFRSSPIPTVGGISQGEKFLRVWVSFAEFGWRPRKRKVDSVRTHYHSMRKRFCQEPCNSVDLDFLVPPAAHLPTGNDGGYQEELKLNPEHTVVNNMQGSSPVSGDFELQDAFWHVMDHDFPQMSTAGAVGIIGNDLSNHLYDFPQNVSFVPVDGTGEIGAGHFF